MPKGLDNEVMEVLEACLQVSGLCWPSIVEDIKPLMFTSNLQSLPVVDVSWQRNAVAIVLPISCLVTKPKMLSCQSLLLLLLLLM
jgi:hypothetical protein